MLHRKRRGTVFSTGALLIGLVAALLPSNASAAGTAIVLNQNFQALPAKSWTDGSVHGDLKSQFNGYGSVGVVRSGGKVLSLQPKKATSPSVTHAALVTSTERYKDIELSVRQKTVKQLRDGSAPNTWETAWTVWHYSDNTHFYYLVLKPNGWELGKADPKYQGAQRFLATGSSPKFPIGSWNDVTIHQEGNVIDVTVDGEHLTRFVDNERPHTGGSVGMYCEDARVFFDDLSVARV
ncbi:MAG TPA: family 16 glycoside hydrolase [Actinomycetota bacterium]